MTGDDVLWNNADKETEGECLCCEYKYLEDLIILDHRFYARTILYPVLYPLHGIKSVREQEPMQRMMRFARVGMTISALFYRSLNFNHTQDVEE